MQTQNKTKEEAALDVWVPIEDLIRLKVGGRYPVPSMTDKYYGISTHKVQDYRFVNFHCGEHLKKFDFEGIADNNILIGDKCRC